MVRVKVRYNKYDRTFKLMDPEFGSVLEDGYDYDLMVPLVIEDVTEEDNIVLMTVPVAHA